MRLVLVAGALVLFAFSAFQNCSQVDHTVVSSGSNTKNNGDPYYGKPYEDGSGCPGDDTVRMRIFYQSSTDAYLAKDNCEALNPPVPLAAGTFQLDATDPTILHYNGVDLVTPNKPVLIQSFETGPNPGGTTVTKNFTNSFNAGDLVVCFIFYFNGNSPTVTGLTDTAGNTYSRAINPVFFPPSNMQGEAWYAENIAGGANPSVTANFSVATGGSTLFVCHEFSGVVQRGALDGTAVSSNFTAPGGSTAVVGPVTTTALGDLLVSTVWHNSTAPVPGPGFTLITNYSNDIYMYGTSGDPGQYSASATGVGGWLGFIVTFKTK